MKKYEIEKWFETTKIGNIIMKAIKIYLIALLLFTLGQAGIAQFNQGKRTDIVEYCHIDLMQDGRTLHRNHDNKIEISNDKVVVYMDTADSMVFNLGPEISDGMRIAKRVAKPDQRLAIKYLSGQMLAVINMDTSNGVIFILEDVCKNKPEGTEDKGWYELPPKIEM